MQQKSDEDRFSEGFKNLPYMHSISSILGSKNLTHG